MWGFKSPLGHSITPRIAERDLEAGVIVAQLESTSSSRHPAPSQTTNRPKLRSAVATGLPRARSGSSDYLEAEAEAGTLDFRSADGQPQPASAVAEQFLGMICGQLLWPQLVRTDFRPARPRRHDHCGRSRPPHAHPLSHRILNPDRPGHFRSLGVTRCPCDSPVRAQSWVGRTTYLPPVCRSVKRRRSCSTPESGTASGGGGLIVPARIRPRTSDGRSRPFDAHPVAQATPTTPRLRARR
ncbi:TetR/AcrR family transcriptional regulator C-terminal domain-containing protein [Amycolatopsis sp. cmx-4-68]|uniref:TetR/AcrR family transcriptional regulator C-terminal domain-containing protein n=1 Tax=Amycolatopsis sp. cmx-4-68 TaxID=2790938 RepID=UPI00397A80F9